ncbi:MAG: thioesterase [Propionibacteriaceae bacterium]|nr:thioesterase [Propionibacteriaceae bacterium]
MGDNEHTAGDGRRPHAPGTDLAVGVTASVTATVTPSDTAQAVGSGDLPVLATPVLIGLCEQAACLCLAGALGEGCTSVGTRIDLEHTAATPVGGSVTATATVTAVSGRQIDFEVSAADSAGLVGRGVHTRVVVNAERFVDRAAQRG